MGTIDYAKIFSSSSGQWYVYITQTNEILTIDKDWFEVLDEQTRDDVVIEELKKAGLLSYQIPKQIQWDVIHLDDITVQQNLGYRIGSAVCSTPTINRFRYPEFQTKKSVIAVNQNNFPALSLVELTI